jgi:hypothetical protein
MPCSPLSAKGVSKKVVISRELVCWGEAALPATGRFIRRVTADFNLTKESYESAEIRTSQQISDMRHGTRSVVGSLKGELSAGSYFDLAEGIMARDFTVVPALTGLSITIAAVGETYTLTRAAGSWIGSGVFPGVVIRLTAGAFAPANLNKNLFVLSISATVCTVKVMNSTPMTAEGPIATATVSIPGKSTFVPLSGHTDASYTVEEQYTDINQYERFDGCKVTKMAVQIPASGLVTVDFSISGKDMARADVTPYFTAPTAQTSTGIFSGANGAILLNGALVAIVTDADFEINRESENATVAFSTSISNIFTGSIKAMGNLSLYFVDGAARNLFDKETEFTLAMAFTESSLPNANVLAVTFPRCKLNGFEKADSQNGIVVSSPFVALENGVVAGGLPATTVQMQDTSL